MKHFKPRTLLALLFLVLVALSSVSCRGANDQEEPTPEPVSVQVIVGPTITPSQTPSLVNSSISLLPNITTPTPLPSPTATPPQAELPAIRPEQVNSWIFISIPPGWSSATGPDGITIAQNLSAIPNTPFMVVRRWSNAPGLSDWASYIPDGIEEVGNNTLIRIGANEWDGIFVRCPNHTCRAFFAVSRNGPPTDTLLVYVPMTVNLLPDDPEQALNLMWEQVAPTFNQALLSLTTN